MIDRFKVGPSRPVEAVRYWLLAVGVLQVAIDHSAAGGLSDSIH
jgi:hypothetical protein